MWWCRLTSNLKSDMPESFADLAIQAPILAVLVFMVLTFLKHIKEESAAVRETFKDIHTESVQQKAELSRVVEENTKVHSAVLEHLRKAGDVKFSE